MKILVTGRTIFRFIYVISYLKKVTLLMVLIIPSEVKRKLTEHPNFFSIKDLTRELCIQICKDLDVVIHYDN